jgi:hypothetical protein
MNEDLLRRVLAERAAQVEVSPAALDTIRHRIRHRRWRWIRVPYVAGAVTAVTAVAAALAVGLGSCVPLGPPAPARPAGTPVGPTPPPGTPEPTPQPELTADPSAGPDPTGPVDRTGPAGDPARPQTGPVTASVAVYYQGADRRRTLYREFRRLDVGDNSTAAWIRAAVRQLLVAGSARDPDYGSGWPAGARLLAVSVSAGTATVDLAGAVANPADDRTAAQAVQQLIWTVTAVRGVTGVRLWLDGAPVDRLWGRFDVRGVLHRAPAVDTLAPVWLVSPQHGDTIGRTFEVHVAGIVPEATAQLRVRQGDRTVTEQMLTLSEGGPAQGELKITLTLRPGDYTLQAYAISLADGTEQHLDDHWVMVR